MRSLAQRLRDHLTGITFPQVASELGPGWKAEGFSLTAPQGEAFGADLSWSFGSPRLVVYPDWELDEPGEDPVGASLVATATPQTIVRTLREELFPVCAPRLCSDACCSEPASLA